MPVAIAMISIALFFVGQCLVTRRRPCGFLAWAVSNVLVAAASIWNGDWGTTCLFATYFLANTASLSAWTDHRGGREADHHR